MAKRNFDNFDGFADEYRAVHTKNIQLSGADSFYFAEMKVKILAGYETEKNLSILDVGCGDGITEVFIDRYLPGCIIEGIDISAHSIDKARTRKLSNANYQTYSGIEIPFKENQFDIVFVANVFHHINFSLHEKLVENIYRVLKTGGRLYFFEHNPLNPLTKYMVKTCIFDTDAKLLSHKYAKKLFLKVNFNTHKVKFIIFFPRIKFFSILIPLEKKISWLPFGGQYYYRAVK